MLRERWTKILVQTERDAWIREIFEIFEKSVCRQQLKLVLWSRLPREQE